MMEEPKLNIPVKRYTEASSVISMRIPRDMLRDIDGIVNRTGRTRNEVLTLALEFALSHMEENNSEN